MSDVESVPGSANAPGERLPEGDEAPPAGVRTMSIVRWSLVALMALAAAGAWLSWADLGSHAVKSAAQYHCPMHPAVLQERPGECPICGMDLVLVGRAAASSTATATATATATGKYWCPMHPEVVSDDPEARCEKCGGMKLVPRAPLAGRPGGGVPGLAAVEIGAARTQLMGMRTAPVTRGHLVPRLRTVGFVSANEKQLAIVSTRFTGWIEELRVAQSGERVTKGQVLATVYSPELITAQQVFLNANKWADKQGASALGAGTVTLENDARKRLELLGISREDVAELAKRGQASTVVPLRSPVAGYVAKKSALAGLYVQPGTELFQIVDLSSVWVMADVYERDMARVKVGQRARIQLTALPGEAFTGQVDFIYPAVNPESRTLQARMSFQNPGLKLRPGMYGDVTLELDPADGLTVPDEAVVDTGELQYVFLAREQGRFEPRVVRVGARGDGRAQLLEGVGEGELVVTTANFLVDSESRLRAAVEGYAPVTPADEAREREGDDRREHARAVAGR
jgi:membrane fusion protein, copper/silver efflux system